MRHLPLLLLLACASEPEPAVEVRWISIFASDYDLELEPTFDAGVGAYTALADGPDIVVHAEVVLNGDVAGVSVNGLPAAPGGYRTWLSDADAGFISPTALRVEVDRGEGVEPAVYDIDVTVP